MNDPAVAAQRQQVRQQGLLAGLVTLPFRFFGVLCGSLFLCIVIEVSARRTHLDARIRQGCSASDEEEVRRFC